MTETIIERARQYSTGTSGGGWRKVGMEMVEFSPGRGGWRYGWGEVDGG